MIECLINYINEIQIKYIWFFILSIVLLLLDYQYKLPFHRIISTPENVDEIFIMNLMRKIASSEIYSFSNKISFYH